MKKVISLLLALAFICAFAFTLAADKITIGGITSLTGDYSMYGISAREGIDLYVKEINESGGILGRQVVIDWQDTTGSRTKAIDIYQLHYKNKVSGIIGPMISEGAIVIADFAGDDNMPMITPSATNYDVTTPGGGHNIFRACMLDTFQGEVMATFAKENLGVSRVAVLYDNTSDYSSGIATAFYEKSVELGMEMVAFEACYTHETDFRQQLLDIANAEPDAILVPMLRSKGVADPPCCM
jgi:branched-chain amino acid transport system substrate-binding protein